MSVTRSWTGDIKISRPDSPSRILVSLNEMFKESIHKVQACYALPDMIVRNDTLPEVYASPEEMLTMFDSLLGTIFKTPPNGSKLFLYVDCDTDRGEQSRSMTEESGTYIIRFHTNLTTGDSWKASHTQPLARAEEIISSHNWIFRVNNIFQTGCLFTITVKGKSA